MNAKGCVAGLPPLLLPPPRPSSAGLSCCFCHCSPASACSRPCSPAAAAAPRPPSTLGVSGMHALLQFVSTAAGSSGPPSSSSNGPPASYENSSLWCHSCWQNLVRKRRAEVVSSAHASAALPLFQPPAGRLSRQQQQQQQRRSQLTCPVGQQVVEPLLQLPVGHLQLRRLCKGGTGQWGGQGGAGVVTGCRAGEPSIWPTPHSTRLTWRARACLSASSACACAASCAAMASAASRSACSCCFSAARSSCSPLSCASSAVALAAAAPRAPGCCCSSAALL